MSANTALSYAPGRVRVPATPSQTPRPPIRAVPARAARRARPKLAFAIATVTGMLAIVIVQLLLSVGISQGAYELSSLTSQQAELSWQKQDAAGELQQISSPQFIAANAQALGMVIGGTPAYIRLSDGVIIGVPAAASSESEVPNGASTLVGNSLIADVPLVTVPPATVDADAVETGVADQDVATAPISLENGIPAPNTH